MRDLRLSTEVLAVGQCCARVTYRRRWLRRQVIGVEIWLGTPGSEFQWHYVKVGDHA